MELQLAMEVWDSLSELNGRYWNWLQAKRTSGCENGSDSAGPALFCKKMWFLCTRVFEGWMARVSGSQGCAKLVWNVGKTWLYQIHKIWTFGTMTCFWSKSEKWPCYGLYRLAPSMHIVGVLCLILGNFVCSKRLGPMLKRNKFAKVMLYENGSATFMPKMD